MNAIQCMGSQTITKVHTGVCSCRLTRMKSGSHMDVQLAAPTRTPSMICAAGAAAKVRNLTRPPRRPVPNWTTRVAAEGGSCALPEHTA